MDNDAIDLLISKNPRLKRLREKLEALQPGAYCIHRSWGLGKIDHYDQAENKLLIDFEDREGLHGMDPAFCADKLDILSNTNILVRHRQDSDAIEELIKNQQTELIVEILKHYPNGTASISELEKQLLRVLGEKRFKKWWTATKKLLVKDPKVAVPKKKTEPYVLREVPVKAEDEVLEAFFETKAFKKKINLASKLLDLSVTHDDIKDALPDILKDLALSLRESKQLNEGERLNGIWIRNDLARFIHEDPELIEPTSGELLRQSDDLSVLAEQIPSTKLKRYLSLIERTFTEEWNEKAFELLKNSAGKFTTECTNFLIERECAEQIKETFERWLNEQNLKGPLLIWIIKNRNSRKYRHLVEGLVNTKLLNSILYAIDYEALQNAGTKRIPLADLLGDDQNLITELLAESTPETANDLAQMLLLNQGFEDLSKKSLLARFIKLFPTIQELLNSGNEKKKDESFIVSEESFETRKKELEHLVQVKIPENKEAIATAREHGDLKENSEYKMARQDQDTLLARKNQLETDLGKAQTTNFEDAPTDVVGVGSVVELLSTKGESVVYSILGVWDGIPDKNILSYKTPLGQSVISKKVGELAKIVVDGHEEEWTIKKITRWLDKK